MKEIIIFFCFTLLILTSCQIKPTETTTTTIDRLNEVVKIQKIVDTIIVSQIHKPNYIVGDFDGDSLIDTVQIVQNTQNEKYGLRIFFGNQQVSYLGLGKEVLGQGFDDLNWVGIFEKAAKGDVYFDNVNDEGEIIDEDEIQESDKIKLPHDGIFIHAMESCGGGVIYISNGQFVWIQQE